MFCLVICTNHAKGQDFLVKGVVFEKGTNIRIALAEIVNKRTQLGIGSNDLGIFEIKANIGDTLYIRKRDMLEQQIIVQGDKSIIIYLVRAVNQLEDVTIKGQSKKQDLEDIKQEFRNKGVYKDGKSSVLSSIFHPLNAIYNLFGSEPKNARRFSRYADNEIKQSQIDVYFNSTIISNNSNLTGQNLEKFMLDYRPEFDKVQYWNSYDYIKYIKESSKKFTDTLGKGK
ncbi:hypothetical protein [Pedobacter changchengzhani]|nr:hypothetical protein [Pedobacter changchengzhani]